MKLVNFTSKTVELIRLDKLYNKTDKKNDISVINTINTDFNAYNNISIYDKITDPNSLKKELRREIEYNRAHLRNVKFNTNGWHYLTVCFMRYEKSLEYYKFVLNYLLNTIGKNETLKYCTTFQIIPGVLKHCNGYFYIVLRIRISNETDNKLNEFVIISKLIDMFNMNYKNDMYMITDNDIPNIQFFQWLYVKEYMPYVKNKYQQKQQNAVNIKEDRIEMKDDVEEVRYATMSMEKSPPLPPMPKLLKLEIPYKNEELNEVSTFMVQQLQQQLQNQYQHEINKYVMVLQEYYYNQHGIQLSRY